MHLHRIDYMRGMCHVFALAAQRHTGWEMMAAMVNEGAKGETFRGYGDIVHVFLVDPDGERFDVLGKGETPEDYEEVLESQTGKTAWMIDIDEAGIAELVRMGWLREYDEGDLAMAMDDSMEVLQDEEYEIGEAAAP